MSQRGKFLTGIEHSGRYRAAVHHVSNNFGELPERKTLPTAVLAQSAGGLVVMPGRGMWAMNLRAIPPLMRLMIVATARHAAASKNESTPFHSGSRLTFRYACHPSVHSDAMVRPSSLRKYSIIEYDHTYINDIAINVT